MLAGRGGMTSHLVCTTRANILHVQVELLQLLALLHKVSNSSSPLLSQTGHKAATLSIHVWHKLLLIHAYSTGVWESETEKDKHYTAPALGNAIMILALLDAIIQLHKATPPSSS